MDLSDLSFNPGEDDQKAAKSEHSMPWQSMIRQIGREVAEPLTSALDRVTLLAETGRIDRQSLRLLRVEIERARHAAMLSQQLARLTSGHLQQSRERLPLPQVMKDLLTLRQRDLQARGITVRPVVASVDVLADPALLFAMLDAALDWAMTRARAISSRSRSTRSSGPSCRGCAFVSRPSRRAPLWPTSSAPGRDTPGVTWTGAWSSRPHWPWM